MDKKWVELCEFDSNGDSFTSKYIYNNKTKLLTHCSELLFISIDYYIFIFFIVFVFVNKKNLKCIPNSIINYVIFLKFIVSCLTCIILLVLIIIGWFTKHVLPAVTIIEYGLITITWSFFAFIWGYAIFYKVNIHSLALNITYGMASKSFILIGVQRFLKFGFNDVRFYAILMIIFLHAANYVGSIIEFFVIRKYSISENILNNDDELNGKTDENSNFFSRIFYCWTNYLVKKGYKNEISEINDLYKIPPSLESDNVERKFWESADTQFSDAQVFSFARALRRAFGTNYLILGVLCFLGDAFKFAGPILLHFLILSFEEQDANYKGYIYAFLMLLTALLSSICSFNFNFYVNKISLKIRCALLTAIYDKILQIPLWRLSKFSTGQVINFMSADLDQIVGFFTSFHALWSMPLNLMVALYLLYREVGLAFLAGLITAVLTVPINKYIATKIAQISTKIMSFKDQRMRMVSETMRGIRVVKLNNWEIFFKEKINILREKELESLKTRKYLDAVCVYLWSSAPIFITLTILITYTVILQKELTAAKVFTSLALVNILILPLNAFPWVLNSIVEALVSKKRLDKFFSSENTDLYSLYTLSNNPDTLLDIDNGNFFWEYGMKTVQNLRIVGQKGSIIGIVGPIGCGKSTVLMGILGETKCESLKQIQILQTTINKGFAYVGQDSWLQRGSIRDNIICGKPFDLKFYNDILTASALQYDIDLMQNRDETIIGDDGTTLSGGQKTRLVLARALYQDNDVFLLDDPFASLDEKVANFIYENYIENMLRKRGKCVILCTHNIKYLRKANHVIKLNEDGCVEAQGHPLEILNFSNLTTSNIFCAPSDENFDRYLMESLKDTKSNLNEPDEDKEQGTVKANVYWSYLNSTGYSLAITIIVLLTAMQISKNGSDIWLSKWTINSNFYSFNTPLIIFSNLTSHHEKNNFIDNIKYNKTQYFLTIYVCIALLNTIITLLRAFFFAYGGIKAAKNLHYKLLKSVLNAKLEWWDKTPYGRVVNRLCSDVYTIDDALPFQLNIMLASSFNLLGTLIITLLAQPLLFPLVAMLILLYYFIQQYYRSGNCEIKRLSQLTLSPLYSHITSTVSGLVTIRAHRFIERFTQILRIRLEQNIRAQYSALAVSQWLSVRLQLLGVFIIFVIAFTSVIKVHYFKIEAGLVALAITYALSVSNVLNSLLCSFIDTEKELISVERVSHYIENIPSEKTKINNRETPQIFIIDNIKGNINFISVSLRYDLKSPLVLKNISFCIKAGQSVAIIGRTGSGKSSIFQALLRAYPIETGKIVIDDGKIDVMQLDLQTMRSVFGYVSQTPFIFSGTIRENLTVINKTNDSTILSIISKAGLDKLLEKCGGLDTEVSESGQSFSYGEKQLICLCRLILSNPKIVLIDEGTAHMDEKKHLLVNQLVRNLLPDTTVLSIVHRTTDLENYDWVIEMNNGSIQRQGKPSMFQQ